MKRKCKLAKCVAIILGIIACVSGCVRNGEMQVITSNVTDITPTTAICGGNVVEDGGSEIIARGVCWNTSPSPEIDDNHTIDGKGLGEFISNVTDLTPNTTYYLRSFAVNGNGIVYGEDRMFITENEIALPVVVTCPVLLITQTTAICGGNVVDDNGSEVISRGVCWSTEQNPMLNDNYDKKDKGLGEFTCNIDGLNPSTTYYVRAYATNIGGTSYGEQMCFTTIESEYEYVDLGLPSGLKWATCNVGADVPEDYGDYFAWGEVEPKSTYIDSNSASYGVIIGDISGNPQYDAVTANWGGNWRMPMRIEYMELEKECTWILETLNGIDGYKVIGSNGNYIFLPNAGFRIGTSFNNVGTFGYYWSSTPYLLNNSILAYNIIFSSGDHGVRYGTRYNGQSIRPVLE